jgi:deoxyribonuclease V
VSASTSGKRLTLPHLPDLPAAVCELLRQVPGGRVTTYGALARALGDVKAARWVAEHLLAHPHDVGCTCHRVVRSTGEIGLWGAGNAAEKVRRLRAEGVPVRSGRVSLEDCLVAPVLPSPPLAPLHQFQREVAGRVRERPLARRPEFYCGLDVAYPRGGRAVGAAVVLRADNLETVAELTAHRAECFPYIPGYLSFREIPLLLELWAAVRARFGAEVVCFVDGNGRLHPRRAGVACGFAVLADVPTVGVSKSLLCGRIEAETGLAGVRDVVRAGDERLGIAVASRRAGKPLYVSVGHRISLEEAEELTRRCLAGRHLPEPTHRADRLSKRRSAAGAA